MTDLQNRQIQNWRLKTIYNSHTVVLFSDERITEKLLCKLFGFVTNKVMSYGDQPLWLGEQVVKYTTFSRLFGRLVLDDVQDINLSNGEASFVLRTRTQDIWKPSKPYHVGTHWIAFAEYSLMSIHVPLGFQSFFRTFASFCIGQISHQQG